MTIKKTAGKKTMSKAASASGATSSAHSTVSGPAHHDPRAEGADLLTDKMDGTDGLSAAMPFNANKAAEYGEASLDPLPGATVEAEDWRVTSSTLTEAISSEKTGQGVPELGFNPGSLPLDRVRADSTGQQLTTNQGVAVADNQHSLKAGIRGPALLEDFILREKITHFDHERIPERIVHARGSGCARVLRARYAVDGQVLARFDLPPEEAGTRTPVFARFSTVAWRRAALRSIVARDVRGFAVKFYTQEGNFDLVGNNIPVFFIQDAIKFPGSHSCGESRSRDFADSPKLRRRTTRSGILSR